MSKSRHGRGLILPVESTTITPATAVRTPGVLAAVRTRVPAAVLDDSRTEGAKVADARRAAPVLVTGLAAN